MTGTVHRLLELAVRGPIIRKLMAEGKVSCALAYAWFGTNQLHTFWDNWRRTSEPRGPRAGYVSPDTVQQDEEIVQLYLWCLQRAATERPGMTTTEGWQRGHTWEADIVLQLGEVMDSDVIRTVAAQIRRIANGDLSGAVEPPMPGIGIAWPAREPVPEAGWYADNQGVTRWWDGNRWTT